MFERNKIDNSHVLQTVTVPVEVTFEDAETVRGKLFATGGKGLFELINSAGAFLEFEPYGGQRSFVAKSTIKTVKLVNVPGAQHLAGRTRELDTFDPYAVLGITAQTAWDDVRAAYHKLAKSYHPDRYANAELPVEVRDYLAAMARRINLAFSTLEGAQAQQRRVTEGKSEPVYTSRPRA